MSELVNPIEKLPSDVYRTILKFHPLFAEYQRKYILRHMYLEHVLRETALRPLEFNREIERGETGELSLHYEGTMGVFTHQVKIHLVPVSTLGYGDGLGNLSYS